MFSYQGIQRRQVLGLLHRLCLLTYRQGLIEAVRATVNEGAIGDATRDAVIQWHTSLCSHLETNIRNSADREGVSASALSTFHDVNSLTLTIFGVSAAVVETEQRGEIPQSDGILWNALSQYFKSAMDQLDSFGGGPGTHRLEVYRKLDKLRRKLIGLGHIRRGTAAETAASLCRYILDNNLQGLPTTERTILEYLYDFDPEYHANLDDDQAHPDALQAVLPDEGLVEFQDCLDQLTDTERQALILKYDRTDLPEPSSEDDFKARFGFGWETLRKRAAQAVSQLMDCLQLTDSPRRTNL